MHRWMWIHMMWLSHRHTFTAQDMDNIFLGPSSHSLLVDFLDTALQRCRLGILSSSCRDAEGRNARLNCGHRWERCVHCRGHSSLSHQIHVCVAQLTTRIITWPWLMWVQDDAMWYRDKGGRRRRKRIVNGVPVTPKGHGGYRHGHSAG